MRNNKSNLSRVALAAYLLALFPLPARAVTYDYDALNRLTHVQYSDGSSIDYTYDPAGNILSVVTNSTSLDIDTDGDGIPDLIEQGDPRFDADPTTTTNFEDPDTDGDGLLDGNNGVDPCEDCNNNGQVDVGETNPNLPDRQVSMVQGFNLISSPVAVPPDYDTCLKMLSAFGSSQEAESISRFNPTTQQFETCDAVGGDDFPIVDGQGYIVHMNSDETVVFTGDVPCPTVALTSGLNLIGHPNPAEGLSCYGVLEALGEGATATIERFDTNTGLFEACVFAPAEGGGVQPAGADFVIAPGEGYLLHSLVDTNVVLPGCE